MTTRRPSTATDPASRTLDLQAVVSFVWRGAPLAVFMALLAGGTAFVVSNATTPVYRASVALVASQPGTGFGTLDVVSPPRVDPAVYRSALVEGDVVSNTLERVTGQPPSERGLEAFLRTLRVTIEAQQVSSVIRLEVDHADPAYAARVVNAIAEELVAWDRERARRMLLRGITAIEQAIADIDAQLATSDDAQRTAALTTLREQRVTELERATSANAAAVVVGHVEQLRVALPPERPIRPRPVFTTFIAAVLGAVLAYGIQLLRLGLDTRVGDREAVTALTGLPVLAEFARRSRSAHRLSSETASFLRTNVMLTSRGADPRIVVVTSATEIGEKDRVALSLAESFARGGMRTLLVDADLRYPSTTKWLDVVPEAAAPFEVQLAHPDRSYPPVSVAVGSRQSFDFVPSFTSAAFPVDVLNQGLPTRLAGWKPNYDVIVLDSTPVVPFADTLSMGSLVTGVVLCASARRTRRERLVDAVELLESAQVPLLGIVLTELSPSSVRRLAASERPFSVAEREAVDPYQTAMQRGPKAGPASARR